MGKLSIFHEKVVEKGSKKWSKMAVFDGLRAKLLSTRFWVPGKSPKITENQQNPCFSVNFRPKPLLSVGVGEQKYKMYFIPD